MRKKQAKTLEPRYVHMVEHAYFNVHPPEGGNKKQKPPPIEAYIVDLVYNSLTRENLEDSIILIRRLSWDAKVSSKNLQFVE